eukprot:6200641-Pleurochrysis_carterae.AAC.6
MGVRGALANRHPCRFDSALSLLPVRAWSCHTLCVLPHAVRLATRCASCYTLCASGRGACVVKAPPQLRERRRPAYATACFETFFIPESALSVLLSSRSPHPQVSVHF